MRYQQALIAEDSSVEPTDLDGERGLIAAIIHQAVNDLSLAVRPNRSDGQPFRKGEE